MNTELVKRIEYEFDLIFNVKGKDALEDYHEMVENLFSSLSLFPELWQQYFELRLLENNSPEFMQHESFLRNLVSERVKSLFFIIDKGNQDELFVKFLNKLYQIFVMHLEIDLEKLHSNKKDFYLLYKGTL